MFKSLFFSMLFSGLMMGAFAQENAENSYILLCNTNQAEFTLSDLQNCNEISIRDSDFEVASFVFSGKKGKKIIEVPVEGNQLSEECFELIEKLKEPKYIFIQNVEDIDGTPVEGFRKILVTE